ncbi:MAG: tetratricopeptide repeat protein [ANME-2 cluster archaeon]|nr:MAG: tetratricopeptide repeat protein [ANME-2 cluster archaeon]
MTEPTYLFEFKEILIRLGYQKAEIPDILDQLDILLTKIDFLKVKTKTGSPQQEPVNITNVLQDLMTSLEPLGYYRPDIPAPLLKLLINGLNLRHEDIFTVLDNAHLTEVERKNEQEFLASCAAITQLGYILVSGLLPDIKAASAGPHVFLIIDNSTPALFVDFSLDSVLEIDIQATYEQKGNYYYLKKNPELDEQTLQFLIQYYPVYHVTSHVGLSHNIHNNLGITYDKVGRYQEALQELTAAQQLDSGYIDVINNTAVTYYHMGKYDEAILSLQEAMQSNPDNVQAHYNLGNIFASQGRINEAVEEIDKAIRLNPNYAPAHNSLGNIYLEQKNNEAAITEFQSSIKLDPNYAVAHINLGNMYKDSGRYEEAITEFEAALGKDPECVEANYGKGMVYCSKGSYDRAVHPLVQAVYLKPELMESVPDKLRLKVSRGISRLHGI